LICGKRWDADAKDRLLRSAGILLLQLPGAEWRPPAERKALGWKLESAAARSTGQLPSTPGCRMVQIAVDRAATATLELNMTAAAHFMHTSTLTSTSPMRSCAPLMPGRDSNPYAAREDT